MNINSLDIYIIKSLDDTYIKKTISTFKSTIPNSLIYNINIIKELNQREETLNCILKLVKAKKDVFIIADDVEFIDGWFECLENNYDNGDIISFSTLFPNTNIVQDYGYDFIEVNNELTYEGLYKNKRLNEVKITSPRVCDAICGCIMFIKKNVLKELNEFPLDGNNRIGEMIYSKLAKDKGFKTIVLDKFLYHGGISTKQNKNINLSSISWLYERSKWKENVVKYFNDLKPKKKYIQIISNQLYKELHNKKVLIYGCGTIAYFIINEINTQNIKVCSGLKEEIGKNFLDMVVLDVNKIETNDYEKILITPIGYENKIIHDYFKSIKLSKKLLILKKEINNNEIIIKI